ncbi:hypothetical protein N7478_000812 [Penicillium angulare]|uniref:uncharacterized protein n=1 Tax=Penicillium angulare TaxID=116970 RepID=UPI00253FCE0A|nr:uncharacterized protein N7478_000812 [Penicillium angulare]KAJ5291561.1 hypothetical protein N7478_000812 [Penicillium angulare]
MEYKIREEELRRSVNASCDDAAGAFTETIYQKFVDQKCKLRSVPITVMGISRESWKAQWAVMN